MCALSSLCQVYSSRLLYSAQSNASSFISQICLLNRTKFLTGQKADIQPDHRLSAHYFNLFVTKIERRSKTLTLTKRFELRQLVLSYSDLTYDKFSTVDGTSQFSQTHQEV